MIDQLPRPPDFVVPRWSSLASATARRIGACCEYLATDPGSRENGLATRDDVEGVAHLRTLSGVGRHHQPPALHANQDDRGYGDRELARTVGTAVGTDRGMPTPSRRDVPDQGAGIAVRRRCGPAGQRRRSHSGISPPLGQGTDAAAGKRQERGASEDHPPRCPPHAGIARQT